MLRLSEFILNEVGFAPTCVMKQLKRQLVVCHFFKKIIIKIIWALLNHY